MYVFCRTMSWHALAFLLQCTLFGATYCQDDCSFNNLIQNLSLPSQNVRPVKNWTTATKVEISMTLYTIVEMDTSLQSLTTLVWFNMEWHNEFIQWDPKQFCKITSIYTSNDTFWKPDLYVYERVEGEDKPSIVPFYFLTYTGQIQSGIQMRLVSACKLDIFKFPFDTQKCNLSFGSYNYPVQEIVMVSSMNSSELFEGTMDVFVSRGDWSLLNLTVSSYNLMSGGTPYSIVYYEITIKRVPVVYILTLILPACFMVLLDIVSMFIRMGSGERLGFKVIIVLGFSVLLLILNTMVPSSEMPPLLGIFCCVCLAVMVISILGCIIVSYMLVLSEFHTPVPSWVKTWILSYLSRILCFRGKPFMKFRINSSATEIYVNKRALEEQSMQIDRNLQGGKEESVEVKLLKMLLEEVLTIHTKIIASMEMDDIETEWYAVALVVDRLVLLIYLLIVVITFAVVIIVWST